MERLCSLKFKKKVPYMKSKIGNGKLVGQPTSLHCQEGDASVSVLAVKVWQCSVFSVQEAPSGLKSHYAEQKAPVISSYDK